MYKRGLAGSSDHTIPPYLPNQCMQSCLNVLQVKKSAMPGNPVAWEADCAQKIQDPFRLECQDGDVDKILTIFDDRIEFTYAKVETYSRDQGVLSTLSLDSTLAERRSPPRTDYQSKKKQSITML